ncbi:MAG TPA: DNA-formamidopyrimidine glycosylase family protein, partial [Acidimicrobiales bacterium]|nr:DNA-formamidopyrimidine glycosylase family protein [Acidimicrobiales bacterium]
MPELVEVELYRRLAERAVGRRVGAVDAPDDWFLKGGLTARRVRDALRGQTFTGTRRIGKLLLLDTDGPHVLGLRFGMTGRLLVDGSAGIDELIYSSVRDEPAWDRFTVRFDDGGDLRVRDPRRLGGVELDPDEARLGVDAHGITLPLLRSALAKGTGPLKARLMDQARIAGIGNLTVDEALWRAGLDPARPAGGLDDAEVKRLHTHLRRTLDHMLRRGGSHTGTLQAIARLAGAARRTALRSCGAPSAAGRRGRAPTTSADDQVGRLRREVRDAGRLRRLHGAARRGGDPGAVFGRRTIG